MFPDDTNEQFADQLRCGIGTILISEEVCRRIGEVRFGGSLLCVPHADLLGLRERSEALLGEVFKMDEWLENADGETDELRVQRAANYRDGLVVQLRFYRTQMDLIRDELLEDQHRMT